MKLLSIGTALIASAATVTYAILRMPEAAVAAGIAAAGMFYAIWNDGERTRTSAEFVLICELIVLGTLWPSVWTVFAVLVLGASMLAIRALLTGRTSRWSAVYVSGSALLAATSLLGQALWLVRATRSF
jgi:hypothetical protein